MLGLLRFLLAESFLRRTSHSRGEDQLVHRAALAEHLRGWLEHKVGRKSPFAKLIHNEFGGAGKSTIPNIWDSLRLQKVKTRVKHDALASEYDWLYEGIVDVCVARRSALDIQQLPWATYDSEHDAGLDYYPPLLAWLGALVSAPDHLAALQNRPRPIFSFGHFRHDVLAQREYPGRSLRIGHAIVGSLLKGLPTATLRNVVAAALRRWARLTSRQDLEALGAAVFYVLSFASPEFPPRRSDCEIAQARAAAWSGLTTPPIGAWISEPPLVVHRRTHTVPDQDQVRDLLAHLRRSPLGADLHRHLVGTAPPSLWAREAKRRSLPLDETCFRMEVGKKWRGFHKALDARDQVKSSADFLRALVDYNVAHALRNGLCYYELSVGVFALQDKSLWEALVSACAEAERHGVTIRFLIAVDRHLLTNYPPGFSDVTSLEAELAWQLMPGFMERRWQRSFERLLHLLESDGYFSHPLVVGFDLCGHEPSGSLRGKEGVVRRLAAYERLGVRLHLGEGVDDSEALQAGLRMAGDALQLCRGVRIGHATGLAHHLELRDYLRHRLVVRDVDAAVAGGAVLEMNVTSNYHLLGIDPSDHPLPEFTAWGWPVVIGTDDPSVWPEPAELRDEFALAIRSGLLTTREQLDRVVDNSVAFAFCDKETKQAMVERVQLMRAKATAFDG